MPSFFAAWGKRHKDLGKSETEECFHCFEKTQYSLRREREWLIIYIFPAVSTKYYARCPKCRHEQEISKSYMKMICKKTPKQ